MYVVLENSTFGVKYYSNLRLIGIHNFLEQESEQRPFLSRLWNKTTSLELFRETTSNLSNMDRFEWVDDRHCLRCGSRPVTFWEFFLRCFEGSFSEVGNRTVNEVDDHGRIESVRQNNIERDWG